MKKRTLIATGVATLRYHLRGTRTPVNVMLSVTDECNSRCSYCGIPERARPELDTSELLDLLTQLRARGTQRIGIWGGEPLVRGDIGQLIDHCAALGIWTTLDTNGYLFPRKYKELKSVDHVMFSFDGRETNHEANREPGAHSKVLRGMRCASEQGFSFWTITVLTKNNLQDVEYILDLADELGFYAIFQVLHHTEVAAGTGDSLLPEPREYRRVLQDLLEAKQAGRRVGNSKASLRHLRDWPDYGEPTSTELRGPPCLAGKLFCNIDTVGDLTPCSLVTAEHAPNWRELGFAQAFERLPPPSCQSCSATAFSEYSRLYALHPSTVFEWMSALRSNA